MSQHDMNIANADGATGRADINAALVALVSNNSGATAPATMFPYMWWIDSTSGYLKQRNAANTDWIIVGKLGVAYLNLAALDQPNAFTQPQTVPAATLPAHAARLDQTGLQQSITNILYPTVNGGWADIHASGWLPAWFNQQWGGSHFPLPDGSFGDFATGYIDDDSILNIADAAASTYVAQGLKLSETQSISAVWIKIYKVGNPANNLTVRILPDDGTGTKPSGNTPVTNGTATAQSGKLHTSKSDGEWVRFVFPTPPSLTANTFYHLTCSSSGAVDASNCWAWKRRATNTKNYPHGSRALGDATPTWTEATGQAMCFLVESATANAFLQSAGQFDAKLVCGEGTPLNQSKALCQPLRNFFTQQEFTYRVSGSSFTKDKTFADFVYGIDHDRIVLRSNVTTGYAQIDVYDSSGTKRTVTATSVDISSGYHEVAVKVRAKNDGADRIDLYVDGAANGTAVTAVSISFDVNFEKLGTAWLGGGFPLAPTWTQDLTMASLPSADGWTWTGTGTEANCMSVSGGKLYQNKNGYAATEYGNYQKSSLGLSNATGWVVTWKNRVPSNVNLSVDPSVEMSVEDGTKRIRVFQHEYFLQLYSAAVDFNLQLDLKSNENSFTLVGKGSDYYLFINGALAVDGTGKLTDTSASNQIIFGDNSATSGSNADVVWDYVKYYTGGQQLPQHSSCSIHEFFHAMGNRTDLLPVLYNAGTPVSAKKLCGIERNYIERVKHPTSRRGITSGPTTTSTAPVLFTDLEAFIVGGSIKVEALATVRNATLGATVVASPVVDGSVVDAEILYASPVAGYDSMLGWSYETKVAHGLHKVEPRWYVGSSTGTGVATRRTMTVEAE